MRQVFMGLLVGILVISLASPLLGAGSPPGLNLSQFQALDDANLSQVRGKGPPLGPPPGIINKWGETSLRCSPGLFKMTIVGDGPNGQASSRSRVFSYNF
jgi:hypothetical protein